MMRRVLLVATLALAGLSSGAFAQPFLNATNNVLWFDDASGFPGPATPGTIGEFIGTDDSDPYGLAVLSTGSMVFHEREPTAMNNAAGALILFDPDASGGGANRFSVLLTMAEINTAAGQSSTDVGIPEIVTGDNDDLYVLVTSFASSPAPVSLIRLPSTGTDTWGTPVLVADGTRLGSSITTTQYALAIDRSTDPDTLYIAIDDEQLANDATTNGIYSLPANATNDQNPVLVSGSSGSATLQAVTIASGNTAGTDKGSARAIEFVPGGTILIANSDATVDDAGGERGDILALDVATGAITEWINALDVPGTPTVGMARYNPASNRVAVFWYVGLDASGLTDDRIDEYDLDGNLIRTVTVEDDIALDASNATPPATIGDLNTLSNGFQTHNGNYYMMITGAASSNESLIETIPEPETGLGSWERY